MTIRNVSRALKPNDSQTKITSFKNVGRNNFQIHNFNPFNNLQFYPPNRPFFRFLSGSKCPFHSFI